MKAEFWHARWADRQIAFHAPKPNDKLVAYFDRLNLKPGSRVFVPLCGKTLDIHWLLEQSYRVVGVELSETAVKELFTELGLTPAIEVTGELIHYSADNIDIFAGDVFALTTGMLGKVDAVYDRAALVALPPDMRARYAKLLAEVTGSATQLVITFIYDQNIMDGPPFAIDENEIERLHGAGYQIEQLVSEKMPDGLKGMPDVEETAWLLTAK